MKIALVHYTRAPVVGGVECVIERHAALLEAGGHECVFVTRNEAVRSRQLLADCDRIFVHNVFTMPFDLAWTQELFQLAAERPAAWVNWVHDFAVRNPAYASIDLHKPPGSYLVTLPPCEKHVVVSRARAEDFRKVYGPEAPKPMIIPHGVDAAEVLGLTPSVAAFAERFRLFRKDLILFHPARFLARKRTDFSVDVVKVLRRCGMDAVLVFTGASDPHHAASDDYARTLRQKIEQEGLSEHVLIASDFMNVSADNLASLYSLSDALIFPSEQEGFGLPPWEARLHRLPVFCADIAPLREGGEENMFFFPRDASPEQVAGEIRARLQADAAFRARKRVLHEADWGVIYERDFYALLEPSR